MNVQLLAEQHLEFQNLKRGCTGWPESTLVKMPHCWNHMSRLIWELKILDVIFVLSYSDQKRNRKISSQDGQSLALMVQVC